MPTALGFVNPCPSNVYVTDHPVSVDVALYDQFHTQVVGNYLTANPTNVTLSGRGNATLLIDSSQWWMTMNNTTNVATFSSLTFCGESNSVATLLMNGSGLDVPIANVSCSILLYGCPSGQRVVSPDSSSDCATCKNGT